MLPEVLEIPLAVNLIAVFVGALGGTIRAGEHEHTDLVGVLTLATAMGFGGGVIRDVLLGNLPPAAFREPLYFVTAAAAAGVGMLFLYYLKKLGKILWWLDSLIIGLFACVGANAALIAGLGRLPTVVIGTIGAVGGLILTDILQARPSSIMYAGPPNAVAGMAGALVYSLVYTGTQPLVTTTLAVIATVLVRLTGPLFHLEVPQPRKHAYDVRRARMEAEARRKTKAQVKAERTAAKADRLRAKRARARAADPGATSGSGSVPASTDPPAS